MKKEIKACCYCVHRDGAFLGEPLYGDCIECNNYSHFVLDKDGAEPLEDHK